MLKYRHFIQLPLLAFVYISVYYIALYMYLFNFMFFYLTDSKMPDYYVHFIPHVTPIPPLYSASVYYNNSFRCAIGETTIYTIHCFKYHVWLMSCRKTASTDLEFTCLRYALVSFDKCTYQSLPNFDTFSHYFIALCIKSTLCTILLLCELHIKCTAKQHNMKMQLHFLKKT